MGKYSDSYIDLNLAVAYMKGGFLTPWIMFPAVRGKAGYLIYLPHLCKCGR